MKQDVLLKKEKSQEESARKKEDLEEIYADICSYSSVTPPPETQTSRNLSSWEFSPVGTTPNVGLQHKSKATEEDVIEASASSLNEYNSSSNNDNPIRLLSPSALLEWCPSQGHTSYTDMYPGIATSGPLYTRAATDCSTETGYMYNAYNMQEYDMEVIRCSTPEIMSALATMQHERTDNLDGNTNYRSHSPATTVHNYSQNVSVVQENGSAMFLHLAQRYQDSGYSSDLCMSPVYPYDYQTSGQNGSPRLHQNPRTVSRKDEVPIFDHSDMPCCKPSYPKLSMVKSKVTVTQTSANQLPQLCINTMRTSDDQIQSSDISSSNYASPVPQESLLNNGNGNSTKAVPKLQNIPPISTSQLQAKRPQQCPSDQNVGKRKALATDSKENKRQRHNQPLNFQATNIMQRWYEDHCDNPYPSKAEKEMLAKQGGITVTQVKSWFANKRNRSNNTRPKVQKRQMTEKLLDICHQLAREAQHPSMNNADIIQRLSSIISAPTPDHQSMMPPMDY